MSDHKALADRLRKMADECESSEDGDTGLPGTFLKQCSGFVHDDLTEAARIIASPQADEVRGESKWVTDIRKEAEMSAMKTSFTLSRDEVLELTGSKFDPLLTTPQPQGDASGQVSGGGEAPEGFALVERSVIPTPAVEMGGRMLVLARQMGWNDETTAQLVFTEMVPLAALSTPQARPVERKEVDWPDWRKPAPAPDVARLVGKPTEPGIYAVAGFHIGYPDDHAIVEVIERPGGDLYTNLHRVNSERDEWTRVAKLGDHFRWYRIAGPFAAAQQEADHG